MEDGSRYVARLKKVGTLRPEAVFILGESDDCALQDPVGY